MLFESDWSPGFGLLVLPPSSHPGQSQRLTSTLMAQRPMARTAFRTKSTSTSVAYSFSSANTWGPDRRDGVRGIWQGALPNTPGLGVHTDTSPMGSCLPFKVRVLREGGSSQVPREETRKDDLSGLDKPCLG